MAEAAPKPGTGTNPPAGSKLSGMWDLLCRELGIIGTSAFKGTGAGSATSPALPQSRATTDGPKAWRGTGAEISSAPEPAACPDTPQMKGSGEMQIEFC